MDLNMEMKINFAPINGKCDIDNANDVADRLAHVKSEISKMVYQDSVKQRLCAAAELFLTPGNEEELDDIFFLVNDFAKIMHGYPAISLTGEDDEWAEPNSEGWRKNLRFERVCKSPKGLCYDTGTKLASDDGGFSKFVFRDDPDFMKPISFPYMPGKAEFIYILRDSEENGQKTENGYRVLGDSDADEKLITSLWETANEQFSKIEKEHPELTWDEILNIYRKNRYSPLM